jgi:NAD(P)-dependent dehydrogenase (short-subunit alcohol dehydrogenase family)
MHHVHTPIQEMKAMPDNNTGASHRVWFVTGASSGLGRAICRAVLEYGDRLAATSRDAGSLDALGEPDRNVLLPLSMDVTNPGSVREAVDETTAHFGRLDVVVNNAGIVRDRMVVTMGEDEWDAVLRVHLKGTFATTHFAALHWRERSKAGEQPSGRIINTSSGAGLFGSVGQANYSAAKAGIAAFTIVAAAELGRYGATVNAIAPSARTRMTETTFAEMMAKPEEGFDRMAPENVAPLVVWLGSEAAAEVTGRVFEVEAGVITVADGWRRGPSVDKGARWEPAEVGPAVVDLLAKAEPPVPVYGAS